MGALYQNYFASLMKKNLLSSWKHFFPLTVGHFSESACVQKNKLKVIKVVSRENMTKYLPSLSCSLKTFICETDSFSSCFQIIIFTKNS